MAIDIKAHRRPGGSGDGCGDRCADRFGGGPAVPRRRAQIRVWNAVRAMILNVSAMLGGSSATAETLTGIAVVRERIALAPGAVLEAAIEDISRAGAAATPLARTVVSDPGQPSFAFAIDYDPAALDPRAIYALRLTIRRDGLLLLTTDTITQVLSGVVAEPVEGTLILIGRSSSEGDPGTRSPALPLPAGFRAASACTDCAGIHRQPDLLPTGHHHPHREWPEGGNGPLRQDAIGPWHARPPLGAIGASGTAAIWKVKGPDRLRGMDTEGRPIEADLRYAPTGGGLLGPGELSGLSLPGRMRRAAVATLHEACAPGARHRALEAGHDPVLVRATPNGRAFAGAPVMGHVAGRLEAWPGPESAEPAPLIAERFIGAMSGETGARLELKGAGIAGPAAVHPC